MTFCPWVSLSGALLAIMWFYESDGINVLLIRATVWVLWPVEIGFQKAFRDFGTIWYEDLILNQSSITMLHEIEQVYFGIEKVIRSSDPSHSLYFLN